MQEVGGKMAVPSAAIIIPVAVAQFVARIMKPLGLERGANTGNDIGQVVPFDMEQAGVSPDRIVPIFGVEFAEPHKLGIDIVPLLGLAEHCRSPIGRIDDEAPLDHPRSIASRPATQFQNFSSCIEPVEKPVEMAAVRSVERERVVRNAGLIMREGIVFGGAHGVVD